MGSGLAVGYWVAIALKPGAAPLRCYVGKIEEIGDRGLRMTLIDWVIGSASSWDFFVPWDQIASVMVATPEHDLRDWGSSAATFQKQMSGKDCAEAGSERKFTIHQPTPPGPGEKAIL